MSPVSRVHPISQNTANPLRLVVRDELVSQLCEFSIDRQARGLSPRTVEWYDEMLTPFRVHLDEIGVQSIDSVTPTQLRNYLLILGKTHNPGGVHGAYRAIRAFINWYANENDGWKNPVTKVLPPRVPEEILPPVNLDDLRVMLDTCDRKTFCGDRDRAVLLFLLDSGCRRAEFCALNVIDVNLATGAVHIHHGKGNKARITFIGARTRKALVAYLKHHNKSGPLWLDENGKQLSFTALRAIFVRRAKQAGVPAPTIHSMRRGFSIAALRNGCDLITLQRLLGHTSLAIVSRYLKQVEGDLAVVHAKVSPVDRMLDRR